MDFKIPSRIPQDLQLIQDIVGEIAVPTPPLRFSKSASPLPLHPVADDSIDSSDDSDADSELEVEADILAGVVEEYEEDERPAKSESIESSSDSDSISSSDSDDEGEKKPLQTAEGKLEDLLAMDEDEDGSGAAVTADLVRTKNEVAEVKIVVPEVDEIGEDEVLEKVGEVVSIIDKVAIIKGTPSQVQNRPSERALDSDTLLVFEDRKVLGYIWETFGPTSQPFYRVQFNDAYPLDPGKVRLSREVFHIPARSNFVFVSQLKRLKGSDASNAHDEEPADDELEFSDDEAEREYKRSLKAKRTGSEAPSRCSTPAPEDMYGGSPYDSPYNDMDFGAGPSRPPPMPYDDPYSDTYGLPEPTPSGRSVDAPRRDIEPTGSHHDDRPRGRGRGRGSVREFGTRERGRGNAYERRRGDRGRGRGRGRGGWSSNPAPQQGSAIDEYNPRAPRPLSPTSLAIARATGQYSDVSTFSRPQNNGAFVGETNWSYQQQPGQYGYDFGYQQPFVQPHINPRFASAFGMSFGLPGQLPYIGYNSNAMAYPQTDDGGGHAMSGEWPADWSASSAGPQTGGGHNAENGPSA